MRLADADREAVQAVVGLGPPAVEHRQVQAAVQHDLLSARAARFERPPRVVQPDVDALHEVPADVDVVVLDEHHLAGEARVARQPRDLLQHLLARAVVRMRLAGEDELDRHLRVVDERGDRFEVLQDQVGALVGGEAPREADRQRVEAQRAAQLRDELRRLAAALGLLRGPPPRDVDQLRLERLVRLPQLAVVDRRRSVPRTPGRRRAAASRGRGAGRRPAASAARARSARARRW